MIYLLFAIADILFGFICYILNPIVILFVDKDGNLPNRLKWFQTHDHSFDLEPEFIADKWPLLVDKITDTTLILKIKRYLRHLCWAYRNTGYTFSYKIVGAIINTTKLVVKGSLPFDDEYKTNWLFIYEKGNSLWMTKWCLRVNYFYGKVKDDGYLRIYLGWKMIGAAQRNIPNVERVMLACHINPFRNIIGFIKYLIKK